MKRGQAAMEFLMTYGWAILAAVLAVAALAYYGVFSPTQTIATTCLFSGGQVSCNNNDVKLNSSGVYFVIRNGAGVPINLTFVNVTGCNSLTLSNPVPTGGTYTVNLACSLTKGDTFNGDVTIKYKRSGQTFETTVKGSIKGQIE